MSSQPPADPSASPNDLSFLYDLASAPCFRQSTLIALGGGLAIGGLNLARNRDAMRAAETSVKAGCGVALLSWKRFYDEREATYGALEQLRRRQAAAAQAKAREMREGGD